MTAFDGTPVMCVVIFEGKNNVPLYETGMDVFVKVNGVATDDDFFKNNSGPGKMYPGGPTCHYKGKDVPCLVRFRPKGSIDGSILLDIIKTLDGLSFFEHDHSEGIKPMLLLDAHGNRFFLISPIYQ